MSDDHAEWRLWRNYRKGMVGVQTGDQRRLVSPEAARNLADAIEERFDDQLDEFDTREILNDLRKFADEVE